MTEWLDNPDAIVRRVRSACAHLPEAYEEFPHFGYRWRIRSRTLMELRTLDSENGPFTYMTVHSSPLELEALVRSGHPFFPGWGGGLVAMVLTDDAATDWDEVKELITDSYCRLAPKKLIALLGLD